MCVRVYVCVCVRICLSACPSIYLYMYMHILYIYIYIYTYVCVCTCRHLYTYDHILICMYVRMCVHIYINNKQNTYLISVIPFCSSPSNHVVCLCMSHHITTHSVETFNIHNMTELCVHICIEKHMCQSTETAAHCNKLEHTTTHTATHTATHCNTQENPMHVPEHSDRLSILQNTATHCNTLQHTATHYNTQENPMHVPEHSDRLSTYTGVAKNQSSIKVFTYGGFVQCVVSVCVCVHRCCQETVIYEGVYL